MVQQGASEHRLRVALPLLHASPSASRLCAASSSGRPKALAREALGWQEFSLPLPTQVEGSWPGFSALGTCSIWCWEDCSLQTGNPSRRTTICPGPFSDGPIHRLQVASVEVEGCSSASALALALACGWDLVLRRSQHFGDFGKGPENPPPSVQPCSTPARSSWPPAPIAKSQPFVSFPIVT